jgi:hypothetical protein
MRMSLRDATANRWAKRLLRSLTAEVNKVFPGDGRHVGYRVRDATQALFDAQSHALPDKQTRCHLGLCALVLAGYRELSGKTGDPQQAMTVVRQAFLAQTPVRLMGLTIRVLLWLSRDPVMWLSRQSLAALSRRRYGVRMGFEEAVAPDRATLMVTHCLFHQFFVEHGEPQLTRLFCEWDGYWMDAFDASSRPIRTERPTTISTGAERCHFHIIRDPAKAGKGTRDVIRGWVAPTPKTKSAEPEAR